MLLEIFRKQAKVHYKFPHVSSFIRDLAAEFALSINVLVKTVLLECIPVIWTIPAVKLRALNAAAGHIVLIMLLQTREKPPLKGIIFTQMN